MLVHKPMGDVILYTICGATLYATNITHLNLQLNCWHLSCIVVNVEKYIVVYVDACGLCRRF